MLKRATSRAALGGLLLGTAFVVPHNCRSAIFMAVTPAERITALETQRQDLLDASEAIINELEENTDLTPEQLELIGTNKEKIDNIDKQIVALQSFAPKGQGRKTAPENNVDPKNPKLHATVRDTARGGFKTFGEFAMRVRHGCIPGNEIDPRLKNASTTYGNEGTGTDGGFDVFPEFRKEIWQKVMDQENLLSRCAQLTTGSNSIVVPKDETTPWQTSGGILAYWEAEAATVTQSKPQLQMESIRLAKLMALVPVSDELLEDGVGLESWLRAKAPMKMAAKLNTAIVRGSGVGQPLGILTALTTGSVISVAKETSQPANTVYFANINKMWARMYAPCRRNAIWLINQDIEPQLDAMAFDPAATSKVPVYLPPGGVSNADYATLKGRPVVPIESCSTLSVQGDIILVDLSQYWAVTKGTDVRTDVSMHLFFDQGLQAFRFTFRVNGQPIWGSSITPENGSNTRSWAVTLDAR
jgi:HK97 family phage major capsid protein